MTTNFHMKMRRYRVCVAPLHVEAFLINYFFIFSVNVYSFVHVCDIMISAKPSHLLLS